MAISLRHALLHHLNPLQHMQVTIRKVSTPKDRRDFLEFPAELYREDPAYIRPFDRDVEAIFDPQKNSAFRQGECERFLFVNNQGTIAGRVAVFVNASYEGDDPIGGFGFFDCINDQTVANVIFDHCKGWLQERGMRAMDGPINFGERDKFWGLLIEGFTRPLYNMNYNAPYYRNLFENYGFGEYFTQLCYSRGVFDDVSRLFMLMHQRHTRNPELKAVHIRKNDLDTFAKDFAIIYNAAWAGHGDGKTISEEDARKTFREMKPVINEHICWFVYHREQPIAMWVNIPDLNFWFRELKGKFGLWQKLRFLWVQRTLKNEKMVGLVFGVVPEWQKTGIEGYMIWEGTKHIRQHTDFKTIEMQWIGDFNPKMMRIAESLDTVITRKLATYRYLFDRDAPFQRHPVV